MKKILAEKLGTTRIFDENNKAVAVSVLKIGDNKIIYIKNKDKDGYDAIQIGAGAKKHQTKPILNHLKKSNLKSVKHCREFKIDENETANYKVGDSISLENFKVGQKITVSGISKGKGFAGVMKRHGFSGMPASHGHEKQRIPGSIGCRFPQRVVKGKRMAGHMGVDKITVKNLEIIDIDLENMFIAVKGAVPGIKQSLVEIIYK